MSEKNYSVIGALEINIKDEKEETIPEEFEESINKILKDESVQGNVNYYCKSEVDDWTYIYLGKYKRGDVKASEIKQKIEQKMQEKHENIKRIEVIPGLTKEEE